MFQLQGGDLHDFGIDLTQVIGNEEMTHTHMYKNLGLGGVYTLVETQAAGKVAYLVYTVEGGNEFLIRRLSRSHAS